MVADLGDVKVYTVNGATAGASSSLPDWLTRKRAAKAKGKRVQRERIEGTIELIQGLEFPEASNRVRTTRDGHHAIATGTYKPQIRVWDLDQLTMKFERHSDAENVDFVILSDDWTKTIHLQNDRTIDLHTQGGFHYRTRIPKFGRAIAYHFPSCDALVAASGSEVYRLNLEQGRFMAPLALEDRDGHGDILGVNVVDVNPAHQLLAFGIDGNATVQFWDQRSRTPVGVLKLPAAQLVPTGMVEGTGGGEDGGVVVGVTAIASRQDGLSYAIGTTTGHTLLYDIRASKPYATKDQGYGLPVKSVAWIEGGSRMAGDGLVISADKKVIKIWDRNDVGSNFVSITPVTDLNDVHHIPGSGLIMTANEGIQMNTFYIPQLGPAPRWASFLENITEEMEDQNSRTVYEDYKFVERSELATLGLESLVGTPALKPYMHGYFVSLKLYDAARVIANPFAYAEHREKMVRAKLDKMAETRIRAKKAPGVKVNKALAEKVLREEERARKREERKKARKVGAGADADADADAGLAMDVDDGKDDGEEEEGDGEASTNLLNDPRFAGVFEDPDFAIDEQSREYALLNPSAAAQKRNGAHPKTAVEDEEEESDKSSSDGLGESESEGSDGESDGSDSSEAGELSKFDPRSKPGQKNQRAQDAYRRDRERNRVANVKFAPLQANAGAKNFDGQATFGQRRGGGGKGKERERERQPARGRGRGPSSHPSGDMDGGDGMEVSWIPSGRDRNDKGSSASRQNNNGGRRKGVETFGAGMERGYVPDDEVGESDKKGRTQRRRDVRSGSRNVFRRM